MKRKLFFLSFLLFVSLTSVMAFSDKPTITLDKSYIVYILDDTDTILNSDEGVLLTNNNNVEMYYLIKTANINVSDSNFSLDIGESIAIQIEDVIYNDNNRLRIVAYTFNKSLTYDFPLYYEYETQKTSNFFERDVFSFKIAIPQDNIFTDTQTAINYTSHRIHITIAQALLFIIVLILIMVFLPEKEK